TQPFDRVAYYMELQQGAGALQYAWVSFDPFTTNPNFIGIPTSIVGQLFQRSVTNMTVVSNVAGIVTGTGITGNIEFWPSNYGQGLNATNTPPNQTPSPANANPGTYDFGDNGNSTGSGYGSFQIHNPTVGAAQTIIAYNNWGTGTGEAGLGNQ